MHKRRGFVSTLIAVALGLLIATFIAIIQSAQAEFEINQLRFQSLANARTAFEEVAEDLHDLVGVYLQMNETRDTVFLRFKDSLPPTNFSAALERYAVFLQNATSSNLHANLTLDISNLTDGRAEIIFFDDRFVYWKDMVNNRTLASPLEASGNSAYNYTANVTVQLTRATLDERGWSWAANETNGTYIDLEYSDANGSLRWIGYLDPTTLNRIRVTYNDNRTLAIYAGAMDLFETNTGFDLGTPGFALEDDAPAALVLEVRRPPLVPTQGWGARYNARLAFQQDNTTKTGYVVRTG